MTASYSGQYTCQAVSEMGTTDKSFSINVTGKLIKVFYIDSHELVVRASCPVLDVPGVPGRPTVTSYHTDAVDSITISWTPPEHCGHCEIQGYSIDCSIGE